MTDQPEHQVRHARRFTATTPGQPDIHGIQFLSGRIIADTEAGLTEFLTIDDLTADYDDAVIHWADEQQPVTAPAEQPARTTPNNPPTSKDSQ